MKRSVLKGITAEGCSHAQSSAHVGLDELDIGSRAQKFIAQLGRPQRTAVLHRVKKFYMRIVDELNLRVPKVDSVVALLAVLEPHLATSGSPDARTNFHSLLERDEIKHRGQLVLANDGDMTWDTLVTKLENGWNALGQVPAPKGDDALSFWVSCALRDGDVGLVGRLLLQFGAVAHSSAAVERLFSQINLTKTRLRNSLAPPTLSGLLHLGSDVRRFSTIS